jgi:AcrR family transcriptional regulator
MYHDLIFESAESVFGRKGYDGATMQDIADEAGVSLKTLYATFQNKQDLYAQIMRDRASSFVAAMHVAMEGDDDPEAQISRIVSAYVAFLMEHEDWLRIHLHTRVAWAFRPADEEVAVSWAESRDAYSRVLERGMERGLFYRGDPEELAVMMQTLMQVQMSRALERGEANASEVADGIMLHLRRLLCPR